MYRPRKSRSLRTWLMTSALLLVALVLGSLIAVIHGQNRGAAENIGRVEVQEICLRAQARVVQLLRAAEMTATSAARAMGGGARPPSQWEELFLRLIPAFEQRPELTYLGFSLAATGEAAFLHRKPDGLLEWLVYRDVPERGRVLQTYRYQAGQLLLVATTPWDGYDPRQRPYYQQAAVTRQPGWTESYPFTDPEGRPAAPGVTYFIPAFSADGALAGVWDADFDTRALCDFMRQLERETGAFAFVIEARTGDRQQLVAHPDTLRVSGMEVPAAPLATLIRAEAEKIYPQRKDSFLAHHLALDPPRPRWTVVAMLPESRSAALYLRRQAWWLAGVAAGAAVLAAVGSFFFARWMARPVEALRGAVAGTTPQVPPQPSRLWPAELYELNRAFAGMVRTIEERQQALAAANASLEDEVRQRATHAALLDAVLGNVPFELWVVDTLGRCVLQNAASRSALGELRGRTLTEAAPARAAALGWAENFPRAVAGEVVWREVAGGKGAGPAYLHAVFAPVLAGEELTGHVVCVNIDVSEQRRAEEALLASQRRLSLHLENTPLGVINWSPEFTVTAWNRAAELIFGWPASEALGRQGMFIVPEAERTQVERHWRDSLSGKVASRNYSQNITRDGRLIDCEWYNTVVTEPDGRVAGVSSLVLDVTERMSAENLFRESEERFQKAFRLAPVPQAVARLHDAVLLDVNDRWEAVFGIARRQALGRTAGELGLWALAEEQGGRILSDLQAGREVRDVEVRLVRAGGRPGVFLISITAVKLGADPAMLVTQMDITDRHRAEQEVRALNDSLERRVVERTEELARANAKLQELDRLKSEFLATMSHELRTPLNSIIGFSSILRQGMAGPLNAEQAHQLELVHGSARHLLSLINDLLDVSRIEAGRIELVCAPCELAEVLGEVERSLGPLVVAKGISYLTTLAPGLPTVLSDRKRLYQIFLNLANNAVKFTERGGVEVTASSDAAGVIVAVRDTGLGIKPESLPLLFEAFRQVDGSARRQYEGTGLGLYLVRKLLDLLGGTIAVESTYGRGSTFKVRLPRMAPAAAGETAPSHWQPPTPRTP
ncbi:MAG: PAS domain S-box protein [Opitutae bacterium]|nr:PAS domain S-box protein [Opitutae bacterium]